MIFTEVSLQKADFRVCQTTLVFQMEAQVKNKTPEIF